MAASSTGTQTAESRSCSFAGSPTSRPVTPAEPVCREPSTRDREEVLLPPAGGSREQSSPSVSPSAVGDLQLPQCLSPLRTLASAAQPQLLFKGGRPGCYRLHSNLCLLGQPLATENPEVHPWTSAQMHTNVNRQRDRKARVEDDHQRMSEDEPRGGGVATQLACKKKRLRRPEDACVVGVRDGVQTQIHLSACCVSLSSNNVLAKEREMAVSSSGKAKGTRNVCTVSSKIRTRGFLKKIQEASSQTIVKDSFVSQSAVCVSDTVDNGEVAPFKRKRRRSFPKKCPPEQIVASASEGHPATREHQGEHSTTPGEGGGKKTKRKWRRNKREAEAVPRKRSRRAGKAEVGDNRDVALTTERSSSKETHKMKRKFALGPNSKVRAKANRNKDEGTNEPERHDESSEHVCELNRENDAAEKLDVLTPAVDENFNQLVNTEGHEGNSCSFTGEQVSLPRDELHCDVVGEEQGQFPAEATALLQTLGEGKVLIRTFNYMHTLAYFSNSRNNCLAFFCSSKIRV